MKLGPWLPDMPQHGHEGLVTATNVISTPLGYEPVKAYSALTAALAANWVGSGSFVGLDGTVAPLAATAAALYLYSGGAWVSKYAVVTSSRWRFAQFGDLVICAHGGAPVKYTISTATGAALGGSPPSASMVAIVRDFVFLAGNASATSTAYWSAINNAEGWTIGTDQADSQLIPDGGKITGLAGGEYGLVFQRSAIHRFSYVGTPAIFQRDKISDGIGCLAAGSVAQAGRKVFFLSDRGFYLLEDGQISPIGDGQVDKTFLASYARSELETSLSSAVDPARSLVFWAMPGRIWCYNWNTQRWTTIADPGIVGVTTSATTGTDLEALDALYPTGIDLMDISLDDPSFSGGDPRAAVAYSDKTIGAFGGETNLEATLTLPRNEVIKGRDARVWKARIDGDITDGLELTIYRSQRLGDVQTSVSASRIWTSGEVPIRVGGRFMQPSIKLQAGATWSYVMGLDLLFAPGGMK